MFYHFQIFSRALSLSIRSVKHSSSIFCRFPSNFLQGFCLLRPIRPFWPFFFIYFHVSCIFFMHNGEILNLRKIWGFWWFQSFLSKLISGFFFFYGMILTWSLCFNLINLMNWENFNFLGLETTRIGVFVQLSFNWWNWLIWLINWFGHSNLLPNLCNDQLINLLRFVKMSFQNLGVLL